jgi:hypothetical protein
LPAEGLAKGDDRPSQRPVEKETGIDVLRTIRRAAQLAGGQGALHVGLDEIERETRPLSLANLTVEGVTDEPTDLEDTPGVIAVSVPEQFTRRR